MTERFEERSHSKVAHSNIGIDFAAAVSDFSSGFVHQASAPLRGASCLLGFSDFRRSSDKHNSNSYSIGGMAGQAADFLLATAITRNFFAFQECSAASVVAGGILACLSPARDVEAALWKRVCKGLAGATSTAVMERAGALDAGSGILARVCKSTASSAIAGVVERQVDTRLSSGGWANRTESINAGLGWGAAGAAFGLAGIALSCWKRDQMHSPSPGLPDRSVQSLPSPIAGARVNKSHIYRLPNHQEIRPNRLNLLDDATHLIERVREHIIPIQESRYSPEVRRRFAVYELHDCDTRVAVPISYLPELQQARELRQHASTLPHWEVLKFDRAMERRFPTYGRLILPEQVPLLLSELPNKRLISDIVLMPEQSLDNTLAYALAPASITMWNFNKLELSKFRSVLAHEWSHLADYQGSWSPAFAYAARLERHGYYARDYAMSNVRENWAVHLGEELLDRDPDRAYIFAREAPLRALVLAQALREQVELAERALNTSRQAQFLSRADLVERVALGEAREAIWSVLQRQDARRMQVARRYVHAILANEKALYRELVRGLYLPGL